MNPTLLIRELYRLINEREVDAYLEHLTPNIVWCENLNPPYDGVFKGREAARTNILERGVADGSIPGWADRTWILNETGTETNGDP